MPNIQVFAGHSVHDSDSYQPSVKNHGYVSFSEMSETFRQIGLEYKNADYFRNRQVVIVIDPDPMLPEDVEVMKARLAEAEQKLATVRNIAQAFDG